MNENNKECQNINSEINDFALDIKEDSEIFLEFLSESHDHLEESENNILNIEEGSCDQELINAIFRNIHSIKGSAGFLGLTDMQRLSHELETLLDKARKGEINITKEIISLCLESIDILRTLRDNLALKVNKVLRKDNVSIAISEQAVDIQPLINNILSIMNGEPNHYSQNPEAPITSSSEETGNKSTVYKSEKEYLEISY
ncbi:MAG: Hpt domain-containing protein [Candidatus Scalindua sp.]|nr:Hpt domain-containing protein [Candidatus Scalindua sp.]